MQNFYYVYILIDTTTETHRYIGSTQDLSARLAKHNAGSVPHTSKFKQWRIQTAIAFDSKEKAVAFEDYLKSGSAHAFARRHFRFSAKKSDAIGNHLRLIKLLTLLEIPFSKFAVYSFGKNF